VARTSTLPGRLQPMLARLADAPFDDKDRVFEDKYDGVRMLATTEGVMSSFTAATARSLVTATLKWRKH